MTGLWRRIAHNFQAGGVGAVLRRARERAREWWQHREEWVIYRLALPAPVTVAASDTKMSMDILTFEDLHRLEYFKALAFPEMIRERLAQGSTCHGFFVQGDLVNLAWTRMDHLELGPGLGVDVPGAACIYDCLTLPGHRGKGYYPASLRMLQHVFASRGVGEAVIAVDPGNRPSIVGIERAGFTEAGFVARSIRRGRATITSTGTFLARQRP